MRKARSGMTLVEIMVALVIFMGISTVVYYVIKDANYRRALGMSRTQAQTEGEKIYKALQDDLTKAVAGTFASLNEERPKFGITLPEGIATVSYTYEPPKLVRRSTAQNHQREMVLSTNLEKFSLTRSMGTPGQVLVEIVTRVKMDGMLDSQAQRFTQNQVITMRADASSQFDSHWVDTGRFVEETAAKGTVIAGVQEDLEREIENIAVGAGAIAAASAEQVQEKLQEIIGKIGEISTNLDQINQNIADVPPRKLVGREGHLFAGLSAGSRVKSAYCSMNKASDLNMATFEHIARDGDCSGLSDEFRSFYNGKQRMFESGKKLIDLLKGPPFKKTSAQIEALVGSTNYRRFF